LPDPDLVYQIYRAEFDAAYKEGTLFILTMHPHISGRRSRVAQANKLVTSMKSQPAVWFATLEQVADYVKKTNASK
jgi:peptidoglycan-N-acetylglucosamine deacetylase